jgi:predicted AAA+ superfamily ATPase
MYKRFLDLKSLVRHRSGGRVAIEVKGTSRVSPSDTKGIQLLSDETKLKRKIIVCNEAVPRAIASNIEIMPFKYFCETLWSGDL